MTTNASLKERLAAVEVEIAELQKQIKAPHPTNWLQQMPLIGNVNGTRSYLRPEETPISLSRPMFR